MFLIPHGHLFLLSPHFIPGNGNSKTPQINRRSSLLHHWVRGGKLEVGGKKEMMRNGLGRRGDTDGAVKGDGGVGNKGKGGREGVRAGDYGD